MEIKRITLAHSEELYSLIDISRHQLKNLVWAKTATLESTKDFIEMKNNSSDTIYGVFGDALVGVLELRVKPEGKELGYWLGSPYRHQGYMKQAVCMLLENEKDTVIAHIRQTNIASRKILEGAGLIYSHTEMWEGEPWVHLKKSPPTPKMKM